MIHFRGWGPFILATVALLVGCSSSSMPEHASRDASVDSHSTGSSGSGSSTGSGSGSGSSSGSGSGSSSGSGSGAMPGDSGTDSASHGDAGTDGASHGDARADGNATSDAHAPGDGGPPADAWTVDAVTLPAPAGDAGQFFLNELAVYADGGVVPPIGEAGAVTVIINPDGTHTVSAAGANGTERVHIDWTSPDVYTLTADQNADGVTDETMTSTTGDAGTTLVWQIDVNQDNTFAWRDTMTTSRRVVSSYIQEILPGTTSLVATSSYSASALEPAIDCSMVACNAVQMSAPGHTFASTPTFCDNSSSQPPPPCVGDFCCGADVPCADFDGYTFAWSSSSQSAVPLYGASPRFWAILGGPMACGVEEWSKLYLAVQKAGHDFDTWVGGINATLHDNVYDGLGNSQVYYGCTLPSAYNNSGAQAVTSKAYFIDNNTVYITTINAEVFDYPIAALEEIIVHEWFHVAGYKHEVDSGGSESRDTINACARVADQCAAYDVGFYLGQCCDASSARDGALCADDAHKAQFGALERYVERADPFEEEMSGSDVDITNTCSNGGTSTGTADCSIESQFSFCDGTMFTDAQTLGPTPTGYPTEGTAGDTSTSAWVCNETCPDGFSETDFICGTTSNGTTIPPGTPVIPVANGPTRHWGSPIFSRQAVLPNGGSTLGQAGQGTNCGPVVYGSSTCAY